MPQVPQALFRRWMHSFEEDEGSVHVYRPESFSFPMQRRPRDGVEFRPDGTFTRLQPGPADKRERVDGRWQADAAGRLRISGAGGGGERTVEIIHVDDTMLKIRGPL